MFNIKPTATINYYSDRLPFVVTKYSAEDHIPADIQLSINDMLQAWIWVNNTMLFSQSMTAGKSS